MSIWSETPGVRLSAEIWVTGKVMSLPVSGSGSRVTSVRSRPWRPEAEPNRRVTVSITSTVPSAFRVA